MKKTFKKYFVPHPGNDHKPHILRERSVFTIATVVVALFLISLAGTYIVKNIPSLASIQSAFLVDLANEDRASSGLKQLIINDKLTNAAQMKATDMGTKSYFAHTSPEGKTPWYWIDQAGYSYIYAGENLAVNFDESKDVENAWMNSPAHKANILNNHYTEIGIATAEGMYKGQKTMFVVQMFGSPKKSAVVQTLENTVTPKVAEAAEKPAVVPIENKQVASAPRTGKVVETPVSSPEETFMSFENPNASAEELAQIETNNADQHVTYTNWFQRALVSPSQVVHDAYLALAALIIFSLILKIFIEIRLQHPKNIAYGMILLAIIVFFMYMNAHVNPAPLVVIGQ
jgi:uncharacterized protein YkwD